jgi:hypothetical protein
MIKIGTNFSYQGPLFLDSRHGIATSKTDLKNWSIPIPAGFEVYLNLENDPAWYTYKPELTTPYSDTGYFEKRLDKAYVDNKIAEIISSIININIQIDNLWDAINSINIQPNLTLDVSSNGGRRVLGSSVVPHISWVLKNFGTPINIQEVTDVLIDNVSIGKVSSWTSATSINQNQTYTLSVIYGEHTLERTISYTFEAYTWKKYFGTYNGSTLSDITYLSPSTPAAQGWGSGSAVFEGTLDCSGGKYPYYVIPNTMYNQNTFKMFVGGFRTTDFVVGSLSIGGIDYKTIRTGYIQSGILQLRYE